MLRVKTIVKSSGIEGLGLFANQEISKGTVVWSFDPRFDLFFEVDDVAKMDELQRDFMDRYAYRSIETGKDVLCADDARFMNHSSASYNLDVVEFPGEIETRAVANRDIKIGEELTINYREIDSVDKVSSEPFLDK